MGGPTKVDTAAGTPFFLPAKHSRPEADADLAPARDALARVAAALDARLAGAAPEPVDLMDLDAENRALVDDVLGEGEVSMVIAGPEETRVQESSMPGLWRVQSGDGDGGLAVDRVEVGPYPAMLPAVLASGTHPDVAVGDDGDGTMNARPILAEIRDRAAVCRAADPAHVINLSNLPVSPEDLALMERVLGQGPVTALSRGYGNCRVVSTACRHVWRVLYFNADDTLLLNTIEVVDVPTAVAAPDEDLRDSAARLAEVLAEVA